jgi:8-oxo-dGTP pyrophosphatase MutT (NUDIX family)
VSDEVIHRGQVIDVVRSTWLAPDGSEIRRDVVRHPGAVSVVPVLDSGEVVLVRQFRAPLGRRLLEIPAGKRDVEGEPAEVTAERELEEEVGLAAGRLEKLALFHNSVGFSDEESHVFLATELTEVPDDRQGPEEEDMEVVRVPLGDVRTLIASAEITDAKTVIGLLTALERVAARGNAID